MKWKLYEQPKDGDCAPTALVFLVNNFYGGDIKLKEAIGLARRKYHASAGMELKELPLLLNDLDKRYHSTVAISATDYKETRHKIIRAKRVLGSRLKVAKIDERKFLRDGQKYLGREKPLIIGIDEEEMNDSAHAVVVVDSHPKRVSYYDPSSGTIQGRGEDYFLSAVGECGSVEIVKVGV